jgi:hypothetical protein
MSDIAQPLATIYPDVRHPYYIVAPSYVRTSAGVCVLHLLCHSLNRLGHTAYILLYPSLPSCTDPAAPDLLTPIVTPQVVQSHFERGLTPIMIYPETIAGNPFNGSCVVRYVMNFPGLLGGDKNYAPEELCFSYSKVLAAATHSPDNVLYLPATDTRIFCTVSNQPTRQGSCFYANKYKLDYKGKLFDITKDSLEITRDLPDSQTPGEIANIFRRSEVFYVYENTALATEAVLCGCPAVFLPNPYLTEMIAIRELGSEGYAWGANPADIARARETVDLGAKNYLKTYEIYWRELDRFVELTQKHVDGKKYEKPIRLPRLWETVVFGLRRRGLCGGIAKLWRMLRATS